MFAQIYLVTVNCILLVFAHMCTRLMFKYNFVIVSVYTHVSNIRVWVDESFIYTPSRHGVALELIFSHFFASTLAQPAVNNESKADILYV